MFPFSLKFTLETPPTESYYLLAMPSEEKETKVHSKHGIFFRAGTVIYCVSFLVIFLIALVAGYMYRPVRVIDTALVTCSGAGTFKTEDAGVYFFSDSEYVGSYDDESLRVFCSDLAGSDKWLRPTGFGGSRWVLKTEMTQPEKDMIQKNYTLHFTHKIEGSWINALIALGLTFGVGIFILELIKRTLLYIFTGKNFLER